jgi:sugar phosphate isomerase/epimerase
MALADVAGLAAGSHFEGLELRAADGEPINARLDAGGRRAAAECLTQSGIHAVSIASYIALADRGATDRELAERARAHVRLAADLGAELVRVFPGGDDADGLSNDDLAARRLALIVDSPTPAGVSVALETHAPLPRAIDIRQVLERAARPGVPVIWDVLHTWLAGEAPAESAELLRGRLAYVQVKDVSDRERLTPCALGEGLLPLDAVVGALRAIGYDGWVSWEYEKAWHAEAPAFEQVAGRGMSWLNRAFAR